MGRTDLTLARRCLHAGAPAKRLLLALALGVLGALGALLALDAPALRAAPSGAPGCVVSNSNDSGAGSLREAVACASSGGAVSFDPGLGGQTIVLTSTEIVVTQTNVTIDGAGAPGVMLSGNNASRIFNATASPSTLTLNNLTLSNGAQGSFDGGALYVAGTLVLSSTNILSSTATGNGGGAYVSGIAYISGGLFQNNQSQTQQGGGLYAATGVRLTDTQFLSNTAATSGGGVRSVGGAILNGGLFQNNRSTGNDGGGLFTSGIVTLTGTQFLSNTAGTTAGGLRANGVATLNGGLFQNNRTTSQDGGGLYTGSTLMLTGTQFLSNTAGTTGGGLRASGAATVTGALFQNNRTTNQDGGGMYAGSTLMLSGTQFISNTAATTGGAVRVNGAATVSGGLFQNNQSPTQSGGAVYANTSLVLVDTQFIGNLAGSAGGGVRATGAVTVTRGLFQYNRSTSNAGGGLYANNALALSGTQFLSNTAGTTGGGLYANNTLTLTGTQFVSNTSGNQGGGVRANGVATLKGGLFQGNQSTASDGGGLYASSNLSLTGTQFLSNTSGNQGGGLFASAAVTATNGLFAGNQGPNSGGGLYASGAALVSGGQFQSNQSPVGSGAGLYANNTLVLTGAQFLGNTATVGSGLTVRGAATLNGALFQDNQCMVSGCLAAGWYAGAALTLTQFITTSDGIWDDGLTTQAADGLILFNGSQPQTIAGSGSTTFSNMEVANGGAGVWLGQSITVTNRLTLSGDLTTTDAYTLFLTAGATSSGSGDVWGTTVREHAFSTGVTYPFGNPNVALNFAGGTPPTQMSVALTRSIPADAYFDNAVQRFYTITQSGGSNFTATLRLHYQDGELNGNTEGSLKLYHYLGSQFYLKLVPTAFDTTDNWVESDKVTSFSPWAVSELNPQLPTAVRLVSLDARASDQGLTAIMRASQDPVAPGAAGALLALVAGVCALRQRKR